MEDLRRMFNRHISKKSINLGGSKKAFEARVLDKKGLKDLIIATGVKDVTDSSIDAIFNEMDTDAN